MVSRIQPLSTTSISSTAKPHQIPPPLKKKSSSQRAQHLISQSFSVPQNRTSSGFQQTSRSFTAGANTSSNLGFQAGIPPPPFSDDFSESTCSSNNHSISITSTEFHIRPSAKSKMSSSMMSSASDQGGGSSSLASLSAANNSSSAAFSQFIQQAQQRALQVGGTGDGAGGHPLPQPPRHFLCPIQNTLLVDPVIDGEGHTYERDAILRWLVLTNRLTAVVGVAGDDSSCGTSPITGNLVSLKDLKEDTVVKSAIERWQKECWVRFLLLENRENGIPEESPEEGHNSSEDRVAREQQKNKQAKKKPSRNMPEKKIADGGIVRNEKGMWVVAGNDDIPAVGSMANPLDGLDDLPGYKKKSKKSTSQSAPGGLLDGLEDLPGKRPGKRLNSTSASGGSHNNKLMPSSSRSNTSHASHKSHTSQKSSKSRGSKHREYKGGDDTMSSDAKSHGSTHASSHLSHDKTVARQNSSANLPPPPPKSQQRDRKLASSGNSKSKTPTRVKDSGNSRSTALTAPTTPTSSAPSHSSRQSSPVSAKAPISTIVPANSSGGSFCSNLSAYDNYFSGAGATQAATAHNGWSVPLGVHKVVSRGPGLAVTTQVHRRSAPVRVPRADINGHSSDRDLVIPPGSYVEIVETEVHGDRVRGRVEWTEEVECVRKKKTKMQKAKKRTSRLLKRGSRRGRDESKEDVRLETYEGWISLQWARDDDVDDQEGENRSGATDEDAGPWTEPIPLGVYRINFGAGLPLRETSERDSVVLGKLERGQCVEVVQTQVNGDRVRARVMVPQTSDLLAEGGDGKPSGGMKYTFGWISLLNAMTGSSGASPVPLGAYVVVAEPGCVVTEGGGLNSKVRGTLVPGSCMEVVATRMEEGVVRGLIAAGGHVTLFVPPGSRSGGATVSAKDGRKNGDGGRMFAMPVPLGTYQVIQNGLSVTTGISSSSQITMKLQLNASAEVVETRVEDGRVRGRICAVINEDGSRVVGYGQANGSTDAGGWINLFEPSQRWAKIICFKGGRPVGGGQKRKSGKPAA